MKDVYFLLVPGTMLLDLAGTAEVFRIATECGAHYRLHYVAPTRRPRMSIGLTLAGLSALPSRLPQDATIIVPGVAHSIVDHQAPEFLVAAEWLSRVVTPAHRLCTVCSGVFVAARSGLLKGRSCTTHHTLTDRLALEYPEVNVLRNRIFVRDGHVFTSAGVTTGIDLALHLISEDASPQVALDVARMLVVYFRRSGSDPQLSPWLVHRNHIHPQVHRAQDAVIQNPAFSWTLTNMASQVNTSPRNLARLFRVHAGTTPLSYVRRIRTASAKEILSSKRLGFEQVAEMVGFSCAEQMRRAWQRFEGNNPLGYVDMVEADRVKARIR